MNSLRVLQRKAGYIATAFAFAIAIVVPVLASAAQVTTRSIALSSSSAKATAVTYQVNFTTQTSGAQAFVVDFCNDSPFLGDTCTPPVGFDASAAASTTTGFTDVTHSTSQFVVAATAPIASGTNVSVDVTGIKNPDDAGVIYARIATFDTKAHALVYTSTVPTTEVIDSGSVAISITNTIGVSAAVLESMTFCVSGAAIGVDCGQTSGAIPIAPTVKLGDPVGTTGTLALSPGVVSTGNVYTQISTNAATGAIVSLKSSTTGCGGLVRAGATNCDIAPAGTTDITTSSNTAAFGVKTGAVTGTGTINPLGSYNPTTFALHYVGGDTSGVTSTYGDPFFDTNSTVANNLNMPITFGATVTNATPAGLYSADMSLIATGKF